MTTTPTQPSQQPGVCTECKGRVWGGVDMGGDYDRLCFCTGQQPALPGSGEVKREPRSHGLKVWSDFFPALMDGSKTFEVRFDDRGFRVGDRLYLNEWMPHRDGGGEYTGGQLCKVITYILAGPMFGIARGHVVMGLADPEPDDFCKFLALDDLQTELTAAQQRIAALHAALRTYGWHKPECDYMQEELPCTCGFMDAVKEQGNG